MVKIKLFGYTGSIRPSPTEMVEAELLNMGCQIVETNADCVVETCGLFEKAQEFWEKDGHKAVRIYNLLDVNNPNPNFYNKARIDYNNCEIATTISNVVKNQILDKFKIDKKIHVIGFPIRNIKFEKYLKGVNSLYVGRWGDPNKRTNLIEPTLKLLNQDPTNDLVVVGTDKPPFECHYQGVVNDSALSDLYNAAEFVWLPSHKEGLGLPAIEGIIGGAIPILCEDNPVAKELGLEDCTAFPHPQCLSKLVKKMVKHVTYYWELMDKLRPIYQDKFSAKTVAQNILDLYNAHKRGDL